MLILRNKIFTAQEKERNTTIGVAGIGGGTYLINKANDEGRLTGRVTLYHNAKSGAKEKILKEGLDGSKTLDPNSYTNKVLKGVASEDKRPLVYTAKSKYIADTIGKSRKQKGLDFTEGDTIKIKMGYDDYKNTRVKDNPELLGAKIKRST